MEAKKSPKADLENKRTYFSNLGLIISLLLMIIIFGWKTYDVNQVVIKQRDIMAGPEIIVDITKQNKPLPIPVPAAPTSLNLVDNDKADVPDLDPINADDQPDLPSPDYKVPVRPDEEPPIDEIVIVPDVAPEYPGGIQELYRYLYDRVKYSTLAREANIEGTVYITFVVERDGSITDIRLLRGIGGGLDEQVTKAVEEMPVWRPGMRAGKLVRVQFNLPVKFTLREL